MRDAIAPDVVRPLIADRSGPYFMILLALLAARREGDEAPTLDELRRRVVHIDDESAFLRDLLQLEAWGCLKRELEPSRVRGYSDARRDRFRHRLSDDAAAFVGWLETRCIQNDAECSLDARERFADVAVRVRELTRLVSADEDDAVGARRAEHLVRSIDAELDAIERSLSRLDAELRVFAQRHFDALRLTRIVALLEEFLREHVAPVAPARDALAEALGTLEAAGFCIWWSRRASSRRILSERASALDGEDLLLDWRERVALGGALDRMARQVEASTRVAITTLRGHVRAAVEASRSHSTSIDRAIRALANHEEHVLAPRLWGQRLPTWAPGPGSPIAPPLPRRRARVSSAVPIALDTRPALGEIGSFSPQERSTTVRAWLARACGDSESTILSEVSRAIRSDPAGIPAWMAVARARHLGRGRGLSALGVRALARPGVACLGDDTTGLIAADCELMMTRSVR